MDKNLYKFGLDWLNGVLPVSDVWEVFQELEKFSSKLRFDRWELVNSGKYNYSHRFLLDGKATIQLMYNPVSDEELFTADMNHNNSGVFFSISGDGIRYLHSLGGDVSALNKLLFYFYRNNFRCSRFDVYCDILDKDNTAVPVIEKAFSHFINMERGEVTLKTRVQRQDKACRRFPHTDIYGIEYWNFELGGHGSRFGMFRCYNKLEELRTGRLKDVSDEIIRSYGSFDYWYRLEYEVHKENADSCFKHCMSNAENENSILSFEEVFSSALERVFTIVVFTTHNLGMCSISPEWQQFCDLVNEECIHLVEFAPVPYIPMSKTRLSNYIKKNCVFIFAILVYLFLHPGFTRGIITEGSEKYYSRKKYNGLRDELDESNLDGKMPFFINTQFNRAERSRSKW